MSKLAWEVVGLICVIALLVIGALVGAPRWLMFWGFASLGYTAKGVIVLSEETDHG